MRFTNTLFNQCEPGGNLTIDSLSKEFEIQNPTTKDSFDIHTNAWGYFTVAIEGTQTELSGDTKKKKNKGNKKAKHFYCRRKQ